MDLITKPTTKPMLILENLEKGQSNGAFHKYANDDEI
jgi:hypothetical protein